MNYSDCTKEELIRKINEIENENIILKSSSEEKHRILLDTMTEGVALNEMIYNENGEGIDYRILEVNKAFYSIADYSNTQVIGNVATKLYGMSEDLIKSFWEKHQFFTEPQYTKMVSPLNKKTFLISTSPFIGNKFVTAFFDITDL